MIVINVVALINVYIRETARDFNGLINNSLPIQQQVVCFVQRRRLAQVNK